MIKEQQMLLEKINRARETEHYKQFENWTLPNGDEINTESWKRGISRFLEEKKSDLLNGVKL